MGCGCGQRATNVISHEQAQTLALGRSPRYTVTYPDGESDTFDRYLDAVVAKRQKNGTLTTST